MKAQNVINVVIASIILAVAWLYIFDTKTEYDIAAEENDDIFARIILQSMLVGIDEEGFTHFHHKNVKVKYEDKIVSAVCYLMVNHQGDLLVKIDEANIGFIKADESKEDILVWPLYDSEGVEFGELRISQFILEFDPKLETGDVFRVFEH